MKNRNKRKIKNNKYSNKGKVDIREPCYLDTYIWERKWWTYDFCSSFYIFCVHHICVDYYWIKFRALTMKIGFFRNRMRQNGEIKREKVNGYSNYVYMRHRIYEKNEIFCYHDTLHAVFFFFFWFCFVLFDLVVVVVVFSVNN